MRCFDNIAKLVRTKRLNHAKGMSQSDLSAALGYKNGQFISNVERGLCNIPLKMLNKIAIVLDINKEDLRQAILKDHELTINNYLNTGSDDVKVLSDKKREVAKQANQDDDEENDYSTPTARAL